MIGRRIGPYEVEAKLGAGGMGTVYRARVAGTGGVHREGTSVALKVLHAHLLAQPGFSQRFLREAEVGRRVVDEHVVRTYEADATEVARPALDRAVASAEEAGATVHVAYARFALGTWAEMRGEADEALALTSRAEASVRAAERPDMLAAVLVQKGRLLAAAGRSDEADGAFREAAAIAADGAFPAEAVEAAFHRARLGTVPVDVARNTLRAHREHLQARARAMSK